MTRYASNTDSTLRSRCTHCFSELVSPTSTTKRFFTIGWTTVQRASRMLIPGLRERAREVLEQPVAVPAVELELDLERGGGLAVPGDLGEALGVAHQRLRDPLRPVVGSHAFGAEPRGNSGPMPGARCGFQGKAEGEGFEPSIRLTTDNGFRDRRIRPLCHPSGDQATRASAGVIVARANRERGCRSRTARVSCRGRA